MTVFRKSVLQGFDLFAQAAHLQDLLALTMVPDHGVLLREQRLLLLDEFVSLRQVFPQHLILFSHTDQFIFDPHAVTLLGLTPFAQVPSERGNYKSKSSIRYIVYVKQF